MGLFSFKKKGKSGETSLPAMPDLPEGSALDLPPMPPGSTQSTTPAAPAASKGSGFDLPAMPELPASSDASSSALPELPASSVPTSAPIDDASIVAETELEFPDIAKFELPDLSALDLELEEIRNTPLDSTTNATPDLSDGLPADNLSLPDIESDLDSSLDLGSIDLDEKTPATPEASAPINSSLPSFDDAVQSATSHFDELPDIPKSINAGPLFVNIETFHDTLDVLGVAQAEVGDSIDLGTNLKKTFSLKVTEVDSLQGTIAAANHEINKIENILFNR